MTRCLSERPSLNRKICSCAEIQTAVRGISDIHRLIAPVKFHALSHFTSTTFGSPSISPSFVPQTSFTVCLLQCPDRKTEANQSFTDSSLSSQRRMCLPDQCPQHHQNESYCDVCLHLNLSPCAALPEMCRYAYCRITYIISLE